MAEIWTTYNIFAAIADKQGEGEAARNYWRLARQSQDSYMGTQHQLKPMLAQFKPVIQGVVAGCNGDEDAKAAVEGLFDAFQEGNWQIAEGIQAILTILGGEDLFQEMLENTDETSDPAPPNDPLQKIALAAALPLLNPEARPQAEPILDRLKEKGFADLASAINALWEGALDQETLCKDLDESDAAIMRLALHLLDHPEAVEKMMG